MEKILAIVFVALICVAIIGSYFRVMDVVDENAHCTEIGYELSGNLWTPYICYKQTESGAYERVKFVKIGNEFKEAE